MKKLIAIPLIAIMAMPMVAGAAGYEHQEEERMESDLYESEEYDEAYLGPEEIESERQEEQLRWEEQERMEAQELDDESYNEDFDRVRTERARDSINAVPDYEE